MASEGLRWQHQQARQRALAALVEGTPCPLCGRPMSRLQRLDLDHVVPRATGGATGPTRLTHESCNRRRGALLGHQLRGRGVARRQPRPSRELPPVPKTSREW